MYADNFLNTDANDKVIAKIKRCSFLPHSVHFYNVIRSQRQRRCARFKFVYLLTYLLAKQYKYLKNGAISKTCEPDKKNNVRQQLP